MIAKISMAMRVHRRVLGVLSTGGGKTMIFCAICMKVVANGKRVVIIVHRIELVRQISRTLSTFGVRHGVIAPGCPFFDRPVQIAMVQTLSRRLDEMPRPDLLIVDEAHHATAGTYLRVAEEWKGIHTLGVTASPQRMDGRGLGDVFDVIVEGPPMRKLIEEGWLSTYRYYAAQGVADLSKLRTKMGDYVVADVLAVLDNKAVTGGVEENYRKFLDGKPAVAFCASVEHARHVAAEFREKGWKAASVDGAMDPDARRDTIASIGDGRLNVLTSCELISEGLDIPVVQGAILLRPTQSLAVFLQQVGRVLRPKPDGSAAIILDHVGNVTRHGMPDFKHRWTLEGRKKNSPRAPAIRQCPHCYLAFAPAPKCPACGFEFSAIENVGIAPRKVLEGELTELGEDWIKNAPLQQVLRSASTMEQLLKIQRARGYGSGWAHVQFSLKYGFKRRERLGLPSRRPAA
jgi:superfamily II DNA or RNA helicase